ncbi:Ig-like domain-containing protein [Coprococcus catus]|uniref:Ig-like domain-containing protein n=1 Tax=Coprococcus catus TaxID=116085 RepID=UPI003CFDB7E9
MKRKFAKRILSSVLTLGMLASLLPATALAATEVKPTPSQNSDTKLNVEYFDSNLYSWDEAAANAATEKVDYKSTDGSYEGKGFYFTAGESISGINSNSIADFSKWQDNDQNWKIYSGLAVSKLSESSNAPFSDAVNAANLYADADNSYTSVYKNVKVPFIYDEKTGYYELNSDKNAVYFENGTGASNVQMLIADLPAGYVGYSGTDRSVTGFAPFNSLSSTTMTGYTAGSSPTTTAYKINAASNTKYSSNGMKYGFGMVTTVNFQMTDNGKDANGNDITFKFAGDDDVWVYIDGTLALDIGGTHDAITGSINFATGDVILHSANGYSSVGDLATDTVVDDSTGLSQTNLYEALGTTLTGFAASGNHTLTIYYMDRGQGRTNCLIKFNLPQRDSVSVTKNIADTYSGIDETIPSDVMAVLNNIDFHFTAYKNDAIVPNKSYSIYDTDNNLVGTGSTDDNGGFTLKNGQTATFKNISLDEEVSYYIVEDTSGLSNRWATPSWTATSTVAYADISGGDDATSDTVTVTGSETAADTVTFVCTNSYKYVSELAVDANNDTIVIDYGLPVEIDVLHDDIISNGTFTSLTVDKTEGTYGTIAVNKDNKLLYTLTKPLSGVETFTYTVTAQDSTDSSQVTDTATLTIIPATSVYYEENFGPENDKLVTTKTNNATFGSVGQSLTGYQETGFVGTTTDSTYGTDAVYLNNLGDSYGTSLKVDTTNGAAQYSYSFTGVGTTIYGRVSNVTGYIRVTVKNSAKETVDTQYIDTINYVTVPKGETDQILDTTLYNIPIYQNTMLDSGYDTYTVTIYVYKSGTLHETNNEFYLDGIRVFQPMGTSTEDNEGYATANSAYSTDGEQNVAVVNIREKIVADYGEDYADDVFTLTDVNGAIMDVEDYSDIGPNQELYLKEGYNGSFALVNWDSKSYKLYLGMKAPNGEASEVKVGSGTFAIGNSADCYYDISDYVEVETLDDGTAIGNVNIEGVSGLTALTNLKVTGVDEFNLGYSTDLDEENEDIVTDDEASENTVYLVSKTYAANLAEEAEEEVPVFVPASITTSCSYASKTKKATVNVVTSKDVSYVTINGTKVTGKTVSGKLRFSKSYTKVISGTTYEIIAYNADGISSETYVVTAK